MLFTIVDYSMSVIPQMVIHLIELNKNWRLYDSLYKYITDV